MNFEEQTPPKTSLEAAALILSNGETKDPNKAVHIAEGGNPFNLDALQRAHLRRMMGFDFTVDVQEHTIIAKSLQAPIITKEAEFSGEINEEAVDTLVDLCQQLKEEWDAAHEVVEGEVVEEPIND